MTDAQKTCGNCEYWKSHGFSPMPSVNGPVIQGECRVRSVNYFPPRGDTDWCGEQKPKEPKT